MDVTITQLRCFTEAAAHLSMTAAAGSLHTTQSAVSSAIAKLESRLGQSLFIRQQARGLRLTPTGERFLRSAQSILEHLEEAVESAQAEQGNVEGRVRFACYSTLVPFLLPGILAKLRISHPALEVEVLEADSKGCADALSSGQADIALMYDMGSLPEKLAISTVASVRPYIALPPEHPFADRANISLAEMAGDPFVLLELPNTGELMHSIWQTANLEPEVSFRSASFETVRTFVANGHGYAILHQRPQFDRTYDGGRIVSIDIADDVPSLPIVLARLNSSRETARTRALAEAVGLQIASSASGSGLREVPQ
ncbi:LysR substrate-binding domain-containing protein [Paenarthrobacter sp. PH39-S1]|uniref:LysR substrate-binding domain-containing protein n=1 Tax=Paenarthrobacter sp. PH39-S1 TaxID=3046204 RepID=UPI0024B975C2|nr:LysR substrate-binding domain-containing protein [Paenarthrobacter sp. PH39-S1]MDJ0358253.1 LysR substrate-binding domain-containing protein [Paenarthrobacter sp. PH39-S1]